MRTSWRTTRRWLIAAALIEIMAASIGGKRVHADGSVLDGILGQPDILSHEKDWKELKLSKEQIEKVKVLVHDYAESKKRIREESIAKHWSLPPEEREATRTDRLAELVKAYAGIAAEVDAKLKNVLSPEQMRRYKQLSVWWMQPSSWKAADVQAVLKLTPKQKDKVRLILEENLKERPTVDKLRKANIEAKNIPKLMRILNLQNNERTTARILAEVLDDYQKVIWEEIIGEAPPTEPLGDRVFK
jgi:Spy/CpxP family protein refolding chaperone